MNITEHRQHIKQLEQSQDPDTLSQVLAALRDPATCYTAMCALKQIGTPPAIDALTTFLANGQRNEMEAQKLLDKVNGSWMLRIAPILEQNYDELPLCTFLVLIGAATSAEYAQFQNWRTTLSKPLITVVTIDDDPEICMLWGLGVNLQGDMLLVGKATNAADGIKMVEQLQPDVVIVDLMMPVMDGLQAMPHLRRVAPHTKMTLRSFRTGDHMLKAVIDAGGDDLTDYGPLSRSIVGDTVRAAYAKTRPG